MEDTDALFLCCRDDDPLSIEYHKFQIRIFADLFDKALCKFFFQHGVNSPLIYAGCSVCLIF